MLTDLRERSLVPEVMDEPDLAPDRHVHALRGLARLNWWSASAATLWSTIRPLAAPDRPPLRVLDVACGGGDVLIAIARRARRAGLALELVGCDISPRAIAHASNLAAAKQANATFMQLDVIRDPLPTGFDCILSSLFLHHLEAAHAVLLLEKMRTATRGLLAVNDLLRSRRGLWLAHAAARLFTRSDVVHTDGPRSVRAAFTISEMRALAAQAGCGAAYIRRIWPCRFLLTWSGPA